MKKSFVEKLKILSVGVFYYSPFQHYYIKHKNSDYHWTFYGECSGYSFYITADQPSLSRPKWPLGSKFKLPPVDMH